MMCQKEIEAYLNESLSPLLASFGVSPEFLAQCIDNAREQIYSFCAHWNDKEFRRAIFVIGLEEGLHYLPKTEINPFVVIAIRNSLVESIQSHNYKIAGLSREVPVSEVVAVTRQAIEYFDRLDMRCVCRQISIDPSEDYYGVIIDKYPVAWKALMKIGNSASAVITYPKVGQSENTAAMDVLIDVPQSSSKRMREAVQDGYDPHFDNGLIDALAALKSDRIDVVYYDSFKALTRNFEKLMRVMDYVLSIGKPFVTYNYYISNGYIERRASLIRPAHDAKETAEKLMMVNGVGKKHPMRFWRVCEDWAKTGRMPTWI